MGLGGDELARVFLDELDRPGSVDEALGCELERMVAEARAAWPELSGDELSLVRTLARAVPSGQAWQDVLKTLHLADLYLAGAATRGDPTAINTVEGLCFAELPAYLGSIDSTRGAADDAMQNLRQRLFCSTASSGPKLGQYTGRGSLRAFVRLSAVRELFSLRRQARREIPMDDAALVELATSGTAELPALRGRFHELFKQAFQQALASLSPRQRNLLRYQFLQGLSTRQIAEFYHVHKATVARWIEQARRDLRKRTRNGVIEGLRARGEDVDELLGAIDTQIDVSLERVLGPEPSLER